MSNSPRAHTDTFWKLNPEWDSAFSAEGLDVTAALDLSFVGGLSPDHIAAHAWLKEDVRAWREWLGRGAHAGMRFMGENATARKDPRLVLEDVKSAVVCLVPYATGGKVRRGTVPASPTAAASAERSDKDAGPSSGDDALLHRVARYARGADYHKVLKKQLEAVAKARTRAEPGLVHRVVVDSIPFFDRAHAREAGLGFTGKNTMVIRPGMGSYFFIATLLTNRPVQSIATAGPSSHIANLSCGSCRKCLDACPTGALPRPHFLDASRCLSYLTIEHRGPIPDEYLPHLAGTLYGCDVCQEVCPYNISTLDLVRLPELREPRASLLGRTAFDVATMNTVKYEAWFGGMAMTRAKYPGLVRNALCHLHAVGDQRLPHILQERKDDPEPLIAETCALLMNKTATGVESGHRGDQ